MGRAYLSRDRTASHLCALPRDVNKFLDVAKARPRQRLRARVGG
jgi:hypothetical protein